jgi:multidrug efflux pump subunit AcrB
MESFARQTTLGRTTLIVMATLLVATIGYNVVDNIEYYNQTNFVNQSLQNVFGYSLFGGGFVIAISGFALMRRRPWLGAVLAIGGVWMVALMVFWLILPVPLATAVAFFILRRTGKASNGSR